MASHTSATAHQETPHTETIQTDDDANREIIETLVEMICGAGEEPAAALLVLLATMLLFRLTVLALL